MHVPHDHVVRSHPVLALKQFPRLTFVCSIDILASRIATTAHSHHSSSNNAPGSRGMFPRSRPDRDIQMFSTHHTRSHLGETSSSQERIVGVHGEEDMGVKSMIGTTEDYRHEETGDRKDGMISKTVEFEFHESAAR